MMMLLQWPRFFRSPSRNQIPGATCWTVSGLASVRERNKAPAASMPKAGINMDLRMISASHTNSLQVDLLLVGLAQAERAGQFDVFRMLVDEGIELIRRRLHGPLHPGGHAFSVDHSQAHRVQRHRVG